MFKQENKQKGIILINTLIFAFIAILFVSVFVRWAASSINISRTLFEREQAFQIAEAGIDYYRWHLAHAPSDFKDGTNNDGPYVHNFYDKDGQLLGTFTLTITPPITGSTIVTIRSEGRVASNSSVKRTIQTRLAIPSFAKFAVVANGTMRFGEGTEVFGPIHSNNGIRFDGLSHNLVTSAVSSYNDPDHTGNDEFGVHTHVNAPPSSGINNSFRPLEAPPNSVPSRTDVFMTGRQFPVPQADFVGITSDLSTIKTNATSSGRYLGPSGALGYHIIFKTNDTFDVYRVNNLVSVSNSCSNDSNGDSSWGSWSIRTSNGEVFLANYANPSNGLIFVEDNVWVDGQINTARMTLAAGKFPDNVSQRKSIYINKDLLYTNYDGQDVLSLIGQKDVSVGMVSEDDLRIDAALMAVNGRVGRFYYASSCSPYDERDKITLYGMIGTNQRYGFAYTDGTGYDERVIVYDSNLLYGPPPSFPLTSDKYSTISWEELE